MFFEPLPPQPTPEQQLRQWSPPTWDRPSEGTIPAMLAVNRVIHEGDDAVVTLDTLGVYPNGFTIQVAIHLNPRTAQQTVSRFRGPRIQMVRAGVRFADGREGGRRAQGRGDLAKDDQGVPTEPYVSLHGGMGGGTGGWRFGFWVFPLPPDGPLDIFFQLPTDEPVEANVSLDGGEVRAAATHARVVWG